MGKGKPRTTNAAVQARKALLNALQEGRALAEPEARALVDEFEREVRHVGWSAGYDDGHFDGTWND